MMTIQEFTEYLSGLRYGLKDDEPSKKIFLKKLKKELQTIPIKKTMTGSKGEQIEYTEAEMVIRDDER